MASGSSQRDEEYPDAETAISSFFDCAVCLDTLKEPKTLTCGHSFCASCVEHMKEYFPNLSFKVECPSCRYNTTGSPLRPLGTSIMIKKGIEREKSKQKEKAKKDEESAKVKEENGKKELFACKSCAVKHPSGELVCCGQCPTVDNRSHMFCFKCYLQLHHGHPECTFVSEIETEVTAAKAEYQASYDSAWTAHHECEKEYKSFKATLARLQTGDQPLSQTINQIHRVDAAARPLLYVHVDPLASAKLKELADKHKALSEENKRQANEWKKKRTAILKGMGGESTTADRPGSCAQQ